VLLGAVLAAAAVACSVGGGAASTDLDGLGSSLAEIQRRAKREGRLTLVTWLGYADRAWTAPFERETGCVIDVHEVATADDMWSALGSVDWDGVSASGRVAGRLIAEDRVAPLDTARLPDYGQLVAAARERIPATEDGEPYGMPFGRVPNLLLFRTDAFPEDTDSWAALWEEGRRLGSTVSLPDDPMVIADAALYLETSGPAFGIRNPFELDVRQLQAAVRLLRKLRPSFTSDDRRLEDRLQPFLDGEALVAVSTPAEAAFLEQRGVPVRAAKPIEGTTGRMDLWMASRGTGHPNCMYLWLDYVASPSVQAAAAERLRQAPVNPTACELTRDQGLCVELQALDDEWWEDVTFETTPPGRCEADADEGDIACATEQEWVDAWSSLRQRR
jgi:putative spermidine/putrescine transport system substrate-binding protein